MFFIFWTTALGTKFNDVNSDGQLKLTTNTDNPVASLATLFCSKVYQFIAAFPRLFLLVLITVSSIWYWIRIIKEHRWESVFPALLYTSIIKSVHMFPGDNIFRRPSSWEICLIICRFYMRWFLHRMAGILHTTFPLHFIEQKCRILTEILIILLRRTKLIISQQWLK